MEKRGSSPRLPFATSKQATRKGEREMTRTELMNFANRANLTHLPRARREERIFRCKAWIVKWDFTDFALIKSYNTVVGIFSYITGTLYVFDRYSVTTSQHIIKATQLLPVDRITYLYRRADRVIEKGISEYSNTFRLSTSEYKKSSINDFVTYIENKAFR